MVDRGDISRVFDMPFVIQPATGASWAGEGGDKVKRWTAEIYSDRTMCGRQRAPVLYTT